MVVRQVPKDSWCVICDEQLSEVEISHDGSLRVFLESAWRQRNLSVP